MTWGTNGPKSLRGNLGSGFYLAKKCQVFYTLVALCVSENTGGVLLLMVRSKSGINSPVEVGSWSKNFQGFVYLRWLFGISEPSTVSLHPSGSWSTKQATNLGWSPQMLVIVQGIPWAFHHCKIHLIQVWEIIVNLVRYINTITSSECWGLCSVLGKTAEF